VTPTVANNEGVSPICTRKPPCDMHQIMDHLIVRLGAGSIGLASARQTARRSDRPPGQMYGRVRRGAPGSPRRRESRPCGRVPSPPPPQLSCGSGHNPGGSRGG
jgi:hypothetical protein